VGPLRLLPPMNLTHVASFWQRLRWNNCNVLRQKLELFTVVARTDGWLLVVAPVIFFLGILLTCRCLFSNMNFGGSFLGSNKVEEKRHLHEAWALDVSSLAKRLAFSVQPHSGLCSLPLVTWLRKLRDRIPAE